MSNKRNYRRFSAEKKYKVVKEKLTTDISVSELCKKYDISSTQFYQWQEQFLSSARSGMEGKAESVSKQQQKEVEKKDKEILRMKDVIAEITAENVSFKKKFSDF